MSVSENTIYYTEVVANDVAATRALYEKAFGWDFEPTPALGNAYVAQLSNGSRFGIRAPLRPDETPIVRNYLRVDDIDLACKRAAELGATVALPPMELAGEGKVAIYIIGGIEQGLWELP